MPLSAEQRKALPDSDFAVPGKRALPISDARHVRMAWSQLDRTQGLSDEERAEARRRIKAKAKALGIDTSDWEMKAAEDAGLYIRRNLTPLSASALQAWASSQGFISVTPLPELHVTIAHSTASFDLAPEAGEVLVRGGDRSVVPLGDKGAIVLRFESDALQARWQAAIDAGAAWDFDGYLPHVTISYGGEPVDLDDVEPFRGDLVFGPEVHEPLNPDYVEERTGMRMEAVSSVLLEGESLEAMALEMPEVKGHPNRMPFSGILTRLDKPSDKPPGGSKGRKVIMTTKAAERALPSLLGMAVNYTSSQDGHEVTHKVGVITAADIKGDAIHVAGIIYARDFPMEASAIRTDKDKLGFSWELAEIYVESPRADPLVITDAYFTGAAILRKDKAAYASTSLAASAEETTMTKEEIVAAMGEALTPALKPIGDAMTAFAELAKTQGEALAAMQAAATKTKDDEAAAADKAKDDRLAELETTVKDLKAAAEKAGKEPERKTLPPAISALLAKADLTLPEGDGKLTVGAVDQALAKAGLEPLKRMELKSALNRAGVLAD